MAPVHGKDAAFKVQNAAGVMTDLSAYLTNAGVAQDADPADVTTMGVGAKKYIPGIKDGKIKLEGPFDTTIHNTLSGIFATLVRTFEYYPAGPASGTPRATGSLVLSSYEVEADSGEAVQISAEAQITGDVVWGTTP